MIHRGLAELSPNSGSSLRRPPPMRPAGLVSVEIGVCTVLLGFISHTHPLLQSVLCTLTRCRVLAPLCILCIEPHVGV